MSREREENSKCFQPQDRKVKRQVAAAEQYMKMEYSLPPSRILSHLSPYLHICCTNWEVRSEVSFQKCKVKRAEVRAAKGWTLTSKEFLLSIAERRGNNKMPLICLQELKHHKKVLLPKKDRWNLKSGHVYVNDCLHLR